jgi:hypothetical protein
MSGPMDWVALAVGIAILLCVFGVPGYVIGRRRGLKNPWIAFLPLLGAWIVLLEAMGKSGWYALLAFVPYGLGSLGLLVWTSIELPSTHGRSRWWTAALIVPVVNVIGFWWYAFTLPRDEVAGPANPGQLSLS